MRKLLIILLLAFLFPLVMAAEQNPTQQYSKIFLNPFYTESMSGGNNYSYTFAVNPPDKVGSVKSAIIIFDAWINPTRTFTLWVNGKSCNNPSYTVSTTYAGAGKAEVYFDCSNVINQAGNYNATISPSGNIGASTMWLDLTYTNQPDGAIAVKGTEYQVGDPGTIFLQLKDSSGKAVNDGSCYLNAYYPQSYNTSHPIWFSDAPMVYKNGSLGIYYYDFIAQNYTGVYIVSARCTYSVNNTFYFGPSDTNKPNRTDDEGTWTGDTIVLNRLDDGLYTRCVTSGGGGTKFCSANYTFSPINATGISSLDMYWSGSTSINGILVNFSIWNYTSNSWYYLPNLLTSAGTSTPTVPSPVNEFLTNTIPTSSMNDFISGGTLKARIRSSGSPHTLYNNWFTLKASQNQTLLTDLKGSGEVHVSSVNITALVNNTAIADAVWNYSGNVSNNILTQFTSNIWNYTGTIASSIGDFFSDRIWTRTDRNLTYYEDTTDYPKVQMFVWNATDRNLTYYEDTTNYSFLTITVWNYTDRNLTYFPPTNNLTAEEVWNYSDRNLTWFPPSNNLTAEEVWNYTDRNLTYFPQTTELNISELTIEVWNYSARYTHGELLS